MEDIRDDIQEQEHEKSLPSGIEEFNALKNASATDMVKALQNQKTLELAKNDEDTKNQIEQNARHGLQNALKEVSNESDAKVNKAHFELHKSASKMYGFKEERPMWQQRMMVVGSSIWFIVYFIVASLTVCPLTVFFDVFKNIFKKGWLAMVVAILVYALIVVGIPLLTSFLSGTNGVNP